MARFESLEVWKRASVLCAEIYLSLADLKDFGFKDQITKSGLSIPSNIAEGFERDSYREFANFLKFAKGSAGELRTQVYIGMKINYIGTNKGRAWIIESEEISRMLAALIESTKQKAEL